MFIFLKRFVYRRPQEVAIVIGIFALLLLVMVPKFLKSQSRAGVAKAKYDLSQMIQAVRHYNKDHAVQPIVDALVYIDKARVLYNTPNIWGQYEFIEDEHHVSLLASNEKVMDASQMWDGLDKDVLLDYIPEYPTPELPSKGALNRISFPMREYFYHIATPRARAPQFKSEIKRHPHIGYTYPVYGLTTHLVNRLEYWSKFNPQSIIGVSPGPFLDHELYGMCIKNYRGKKSSLWNYTEYDSAFRDFFIRFDPSNGLISHGFILQFE